MPTSRPDLTLTRVSGECRQPTILFIVGMPRSGTKLLRDLLNKHASIAIFPNESHFIPAFHRRFGAHKGFTQLRIFRTLYREFLTTTFCRRLEMRGISISESDWHAQLQGDQFSDVLRALFACYRAQTQASIVGDKTPEYLTQIPLLAGLLPEARFVHIVRDPRDQALSMRKAWGKSVPRSAYRWKLHIRKFCDDAAATAAPQITTRYEELVSDPRGTLTRICNFLGIDFLEQMTTLDTSPEELGDARGLTSILAGNTRKWVGQLSPADLESIDSLAGALMSGFGYQPTSTPGDAELNFFERLRWQSADAIRLLQYRRRTEGSIGAALRESWRAYRHSGADE